MLSGEFLVISIFLFKGHLYILSGLGTLVKKNGRYSIVAVIPSTGGGYIPLRSAIDCRLKKGSEFHYAAIDFNALAATRSALSINMLRLVPFESVTSTASERSEVMLPSA